MIVYQNADALGGGALDKGKAALGKLTDAGAEVLDRASKYVDKLKQKIIDDIPGLTPEEKTFLLSEFNKAFTDQADDKFNADFRAIVLDSTLDREEVREKLIPRLMRMRQLSQIQVLRGALTKKQKEWGTDDTKSLAVERLSKIIGILDDFSFGNIEPNTPLTHRDENRLWRQYDLLKDQVWWNAKDAKTRLSATVSQITDNPAEADITEAQKWQSLILIRAKMLRVKMDGAISKSIQDKSGSKKITNNGITDYTGPNEGMLTNTWVGPNRNNVLKDIPDIVQSQAHDNEKLTKIAGELSRNALNSILVSVVIESADINDTPDGKPKKVTIADYGGEKITMDMPGKADERLMFLADILDRLNTGIKEFNPSIVERTEVWMGKGADAVDTTITWAGYAGNILYYTWPILLIKYLASRGPDSKIGLGIPELARAIDTKTMEVVFDRVSNSEYKNMDLPARTKILSHEGNRFESLQEFEEKLDAYRSRLEEMFKEFKDKEGTKEYSEYHRRRNALDKVAEKYRAMMDTVQPDNNLGKGRVDFILRRILRGEIGGGLNPPWASIISMRIEEPTAGTAPAAEPPAGTPEPARAPGAAPAGEPPAPETPEPARAPGAAPAGEPPAPSRRLSLDLNRPTGWKSRLPQIRLPQIGKTITPTNAQLADGTITEMSTHNVIARHTLGRAAGAGKVLWGRLTHEKDQHAATKLSETLVEGQRHAPFSFAQGDVQYKDIMFQKDHAEVSTRMRRIRALLEEREATTATIEKFSDLEYAQERVTEYNALFNNEVRTISETVDERLPNGGTIQRTIIVKNEDRGTALKFKKEWEDKVSALQKELRKYGKDLNAAAEQKFEKLSKIDVELMGVDGESGLIKEAQLKAGIKEGELLRWNTSENYAKFFGRMIELLKKTKV